MSELGKQSSNRAMNPWVLHLQKLGLELKCPLCSCIARSSEFGSECPICKAQCADRDLRPVTFMDNIVGIYRSLDAAFSTNLSHSFEDGVGKNDKSDKCSMQKCGTDKGYETPGKGGIECNSSGKVDLLQHISQKQLGVSLESGNGQTNMNQLDQTALSPPSYGDTKGSDNDSSDHSPGNYPAKGMSKRSFDDMIRQKKDDSVLGIDDHLWDSKRQKRLNYRQLDMGVKTMVHCQPVLQAQNLVTSNCQIGSRNGAPLAGVDLPSDNLNGNEAICGFCQSSRISEATGPMLHYANGKPVTGDAAFCSNVIHVHLLCIEWAPKVYFVGESVKNLKEELARGAQLKCSRCRLKGAALGCCVKSCRRSYHFPCAKEILKCRWDHDEFLVLCPSHSSVKFPNEKSRNAHSSVKFPNEKSGNVHSLVNFPNERSGNCVSTDHSVTTESGHLKSNKFWGQPDDKKEWVFCGSALSPEEKFLLVKFAKSIGVTVSKFWKPDVTHVIASTDENGACTRTLKVLMAISNGKWVLKINWIKECMKAMCPVNEEPYEISLDNHGCCDGPKTGRLRALDNAPKLFDSLNFYFVGDFVSGYKEDLQNLVVAAGGAVLRRMEEELVEQNSGDQAVQTRMIVVYNLDVPRGSELGEEVSIIWQRVGEAQDLATKIGGQVIGHTWLLESIAAHKLQPFVS
ncbi:BRCA1-associated RING domain protein 1-like isoform X2 [Durio zibethinus]|uniref:BRCA1-associated RING domain protein 1-like isoform X2 n=1 Tax=Durio zibethinus TaxID=66656 RepID=A0A6P6A0J3_DURZI|nr:BRCA1-associated RING domain protein 1-like isoform X2 [Durio zibethinus]